MNFFCFGLNHRTAPIEARERFAGHARSPALLRDLGCSEVLLLTTCNRVEIYAAADANIANEEIAQSLHIEGGSSAKSDLEAFYRKENAECARHLFRVAAGLDSMVVGETEILGQAKRAYAEAHANGNAGPLLHRLCQRAFRAAKQVRSKTQITRGPVSVGSVAVDLAEKIFGDLRGRKVLVLGAGETSGKTLRALASRGVSDLRVSNRTPRYSYYIDCGGDAPPDPAVACSDFARPSRSSTFYHRYCGTAGRRPGSERIRRRLSLRH